MEEPRFVAELIGAGAGERRIELLRAVRVVTGSSLWHGKLLLDDLPAPVREETCGTWTPRWPGCGRPGGGSRCGAGRAGGTPPSAGG